MASIRTQPCAYCPYRQDVPSGVWAASEYEKLIAYDNKTFEQPWEPFGCHATPEFYCHGWAVTHSSRGHEYELLALRIRELTAAPTDIPPAAVLLFSSGTEAAEHGMCDIDNPSEEAIAAYSKLEDRYPRLRQEST